MQNLSDRKLYVICKKWGAEALAARRKFAGLLPEVHRREQIANEKGGFWLKKRGFTCLYEFAAKLAGMSRDQVDLVVRLEKRFEDKPILREALVNGTISANKLARIVSIATVENQAEILRKVEVFSKAALDVFVKDYGRENINLNGLLKPLASQPSLPGQTFVLDEDVEKELLEMQKKGIDVNQALRQFLRERKEKVEKEKMVAAEKQIRERDDRAVIGMPAKRYVPAAVRKIIEEEYGTVCATYGCRKPAVNLHHEKIFAIDRCHDPRFLKPLCKGHHELAHATRWKPDG